MTTSKWERATQEAFAWTELRVERLKRLWAEGLPSAAIGLQLGCNKNQILGKVHRLGLAARKLHPALERATRQRARKASTLPKARPPELRVTTPTQAKRLIPHEAIEPLRTPRIPAALRLPVPVGNLPPAKACQWTDSERRPWVFCCAASVPGRSWCREHNARVWASAA